MFSPGVTRIALVVTPGGCLLDIVCMCVGFWCKTVAMASSTIKQKVGGFGHVKVPSGCKSHQSCLHLFIINYLNLISGIMSFMSKKK